MGEVINILLGRFLNRCVHQGVVKTCWYKIFLVINLFLTAMMISDVVGANIKIIGLKFIQNVIHHP